MLTTPPSSSSSSQARTIFEKATKVSFKQVDDLAGVWCEFGEMELRHENYEQALRILRVSGATLDYTPHVSRLLPAAES